MNKYIINVVAVVALAVSGCASQVALLQGKTNSVPTSSNSQSFFIGGIGQYKSTDAAKICNGAGNVAKVETIQTGTDILLSIVTLWLYTPRTANVYCKN